MVRTWWLRRAQQRLGLAPRANSRTYRRPVCRPTVEAMEDRVVPASRLFAIPPGSSIVELNTTTGAAINTIPAPEPTTNGVNGLAFDGSRLFFINGGGSDRLYELNPNTGAVVDSDLIAVGSGDYSGLAVVGGLVYIEDQSADRIYVFDPATDTITNTLNPGADLVGGLTGASSPGALIGPINGGNLIAEINPATGAITNTFQPGFPNLLGAAYVGNEIYLGSGGSAAIFRYSRTGTFLGQISTPFVVAALGSDDTTGAPSPPAPGSQFVNGNFEAGNVSGWTVFNQQPAGAASPGFQAYTGPSPIGSQLPAPPQGNFAAFANHGNAGTYILYQDVTLPAGQFHTLSLQAYYNNFAAEFFTPNTLAVTQTAPNQQFRIDVVTTTGDLLSTDPSVVLLNLFRTDPGEPRFLGPTTLTADLTPFAGQAVRLRVAVVDTIAPLYAAVDDVRLTSAGTAPTGTVTGVKFDDADGDGARDPGEAGLPGWTIYADLNNNRRPDPGEPSAVTDANGTYTLTIPPGSATIREVQQAGWVQTTPAADRIFSARVPSAGGPQLISEYTTTGTVITTFAAPVTATTQGPQGLAFSGDSLFYVDGLQQPLGSTGPHTLYELDPATGAVLDSDVLPATTEINGLAYLGGLVYVLSHPSNQVLVFDPATDTVVRTLNVGADLFGGLTGAADLGLLFAATPFGQIVAINPQTGGVVRTLSPNQGSSPQGLAYSGGTLLVTFGGNPFLSRVDPQTGAVVGTLNLSGPGGGVAGLAGDGRVPGGQRVTLAANQTVAVNIGNRRDEGTVSGVKFNDLDGDGTRDPGEPTLPGWTVYADLNNNRRFDAGEPSTTTDATGAYTLTVPSGIQSVREVAQAGWVQTAPLAHTLYTTVSFGSVIDLATINPATGLATRVGGPVGTSQAATLAVAPDGSLWTILDSLNTTTAQLARVDPATGIATRVGSPVGLPSATGPIRALEADAAGILYAATASGELYRLNTTTGAPTLVGRGVPEPVDLAFDPAGGLWALSQFGNTLYRVDPATGAAAFAANITGAGGAVGLSIHPGTGTFYLTDRSLLYTLNPATGQATPVGPAQATLYFGTDFATDNGHTVTVTPGSAAAGRDFANRRNEGTVSGVKYDDRDGNGTRGPGEPGLPGWTVYADLNDNSRLDAGEPAAVTGSDGSYQLTVPSGSYAIREVSQAGWIATGPGGDRVFSLRPTTLNGPLLVNIFELDQYGFVKNTFPAPAPVNSFGAQGLAVGPNSIFYMDSSQAGTGGPRLYELDPATGAVIDSDALQIPGVTGLAYLGGLVYALVGPNQLFAFNPVSDTIVRVQTILGGPGMFGGLTGAADLGLLFASANNLIVAIDPVTGTIVRTLVPNGAGSVAGGLAYRNGELLGVQPGSQGLIFRIDPQTGAVLGVLAPAGPNSTGLGGDGAAPGPHRVTVTPGATLSGRDFGDTQPAPLAAADDAASVGENDVLIVPAPGVLANDAGGFGLKSVVAVNGTTPAFGQPVLLPSGSLLRVNGDGSYSYVPAPAFNALRVGQTATDSFTYTVADGLAATATAVVRITITGANDPPQAAPDSAATTEDAATSGDVLANDTDPDAGDTLSVVAVNGSAAAVGQSITLASGARVVLRADGTFDYDPTGAFDRLRAGQSDQDQFSYTVADATGATATTTVTVRVDGVNDAPTAAADAGETDEDTPLLVAAPGVLGNDTDPDLDDTRTVVEVGGNAAAVGQPIALPSGARLTIRSDGSYTYDPREALDALAAGETATDVIQYTVADAAGAASTATLTLTVRGLNDIPAAIDDAATTDEDTAVSVAAPGVLGNDTDPDAGAALSVVEVSAGGAVGQPVALPSGAVVTVFADGGYTYDPNGAFESLRPGETATDLFTYHVSDGTALATATVRVTVTGVNDRPVAQPVSLTVSEDGPAATSSFVAADAEPGALMYAIVTPPAGGSVVNNGDGTFTFDPGADFQNLPAGGQRTVTFSYTATDADGGPSDPVTVTVVVTGANDAPVAAADAGATNEDTAVSVAAPGVLGNDTDVDAGDTRTVAAVNGSAAAVGQPVTLASGAVVTVLADGSYTYDPNGAFEALGPGQTAADSFTYTVRDLQGGTATATVTVTIGGVNDAPVARPDAYTTDEDTDLVVVAAGILLNDSDVDGGALTAAVGAGPTNGTLTLNADGSFTYRPALNFHGTDGFTYTVSDGRGGSATGTVTIVVESVNDRPTLAGATFTLPENSPNGTVVGTVAGADVDGDTLTYRIAGGNTVGAFAINASTGRITVANAAALDFETTPVFTLTVEARDPGGLTAAATVTVRLTDVITPPRIDIDPNDARNRINSRSGGRVSVAILSSAEFDARQVDVLSLRFGRTGQENSLSVHQSNGPRYKLQDVNGDGRLDMVVEFEIALTGFRPGDTRGYLTGKLLNGFAFAADDVVSVN